MSALARFTSIPSRPVGDGTSRRGRAPGRHPLWRNGLMALTGAALLAGALDAALGVPGTLRPAGEALATAASLSRWSDIVHPLALYDLAGTAFSKRPTAYRARRHGPDGAREDIMTFGRLGDAKPYLQMSLMRAGTETADLAGDGLADGLARLAGTWGLMATRIRAGARVDTRFGQIDTADLLLWDDGAATPCLGFRGMAGGGTVLRLSGFACGAPGRPIGRAALACAIDRIDLLSAGDDAPLRAVFVSAERWGGTSCLGDTALSSGGPLLTAGRGLGWLDPDGAMPPLRGLFATGVRQRQGEPARRE